MYETGFVLFVTDQLFMKLSASISSYKSLINMLGEERVKLNVELESVLFH